MTEASPKEAIRAGRLDGLDALRGLAALAVVVYHYAYRAPEIYPELGSMAGITWWGQYGVHLFFVISGFVIFMTLQRATPRSFVITRFIRLYPIYWVCVVLTASVVWGAGLPGREVSGSEAAVNLTMLQAFLRVPAVDGAYWTLAAELAFYVQVGLLFFVGLLRGRRLVPVLYLWAGAVTAVTVAAEHAGGPLRMVGLIPGLRWIPLFVAGMALYRIWAGDRGKATMLLPVLCALAMAVENIETAIVSLVVVGLVVAVATPRVGARLARRPLVALGAISYPLYLIHQNVGYVVLRRLESWGASQLLAVSIALVLIVALATVLTRTVDEPVRRSLRARLLGQGRVGGRAVVRR